MAITTEYEKLLIAEDRRAKRRKYALRFVTSVIVNILCAFSNGWMLMLAVGIAHAEWIPQLPTIGYWWAVLIVYLLGGVFSKATPLKDSGK
jgi:sterol desaturase/sphingolipid hydroxylase (fatty acid hydroxylase superfamily)